MSANVESLFARAAAAESSTGDAFAERILDGGLACFSEMGLRRPTVEDIARRAGVSRVTVYRRFENKATLIEAVLLRECQRCLTALDDAITGVEALDERIVEGFVFALRYGRGHPLVGGLLQVEPEEVLPYLTVRADTALAVAREYLAEHIRLADNGAFDPVQIAEIMARIVVSFVVTEDSSIELDTDEDLRRFARRYLVPLVH
ncbi:TetR family transcriptional regulator [Halopolyspora algeriensis]|uniref:TetR family transcriptional regulator n=1 Tax=Halopolyspora algeriensis TaxID=1500506 RepID=A0A368VFQ1_9ACTN|nr:TetR/AcrR family transcriptional regulator [Halopolyspora algeriensis]RCW38494.1 TetR family transcriptional regulator [Halopolyspora algeriensis]TQM42624.1 TetR family transcriptional regulator [Halopolyspora algeriensis]